MNLGNPHHAIENKVKRLMTESHYLFVANAAMQSSTKAADSLV
jgi:hypothetical protein